LDLRTSKADASCCTTYSATVGDPLLLLLLLPSNNANLVCKPGEGEENYECNKTRQG